MGDRQHRGILRNAMGDSEKTITELLADWHQGDENALHALIPLVYDELRGLARQHMAGEAESHTLQPTALVGEVYLRLTGHEIPTLESRRAFFSFASMLMQQILVDYARRRKSKKRGMGVQPEPIEEVFAIPLARTIDPADVLAIHDALERLHTLSARQAEIIKLRFFLGLAKRDVATVLETSERTVDREYALARAFLERELRST